MPGDPFTRAWRYYSAEHGGRLSEATFKAFQRGWRCYQYKTAGACSPDDQALIAGYIAHGAENVEDRMVKGMNPEGQ